MMSGDRRRRTSRAELPATDHGQSSSSDGFHSTGWKVRQPAESSSSFSTAHRRVFSTANSNKTNTDESAHSDEIGADSRSEVSMRVEFEPAVNGPMPPMNVSPSILRSYCVKIFEDGRLDRVNNEMRLVFPISSDVNAKAFRLMVNNIGNVPSATPSRNGSEMAIDFLDFFNLCVVLWSHVCRIDHWVPVAEYIRNSHWKDDLMQWPAGRLTQWLFIALVFDWPSIFETASSALIVDFSELDAELQRASYLPDTVVNSVLDKRKEYMSKTYDHILNIGWSLITDPRTRLLSLQPDIHTDLSQAPLNLDLRHELPEDIHKRISPGEVLRVVTRAIGKTHAKSQAQSPVLPSGTPAFRATPPSSVNSDNRKSAQRKLTEDSKTLRKAQGGDAMFVVLRGALSFGKDAWKRHTAKTPSSSPPNGGPHGPPDPEEPPSLTLQETETLCQQLLAQIDEFRTCQLCPLNIDDFESLRAQHVISIPMP